MHWHSFTDEIKRFDGKGGWFYVTVPLELSVPFKELASGGFGFIAITAKTPSTEWDTSLLPMEDGTYFIALPAKIRKAQQMERGDVVTIEFCFRSR